MHDLDHVTQDLDDAGLDEPRAARADDRHELAVVRDAARLLEMTSHSELDALLDGVLSRAAMTAGTGLPPATARAVTLAIKRGLRGLGRTVLPVAGRSFDAWVRPGGGSEGVAATLHVSRLLGLPVEGLSTEDREYEIATAYVRFAHVAARRAFRLARSAPPQVAAERALASARRETFPALRPRVRRGRWRRREAQVVVEGL